MTFCSFENIISSLIHKDYNFSFFVLKTTKNRTKETKYNPFLFVLFNPLFCLNATKPIYK